LESQVCIPADTCARDGDGGDGRDIASVKDYERLQNSVNNFQRQHKRIFRCIPSDFRIGAPGAANFTEVPAQLYQPGTIRILLRDASEKQ